MPSQLYPSHRSGEGRITEGVCETPSSEAPAPQRRSASAPGSSSVVDLPQQAPSEEGHASSVRTLSAEGASDILLPEGTVCQALPFEDKPLQ